MTSPARLSCRSLSSAPSSASWAWRSSRRAPTWCARRSTSQEHHKQPLGLVHGGVYASIAESITSDATFRAVYPDGNSSQGLSNQTSFLRPIFGGTIHAVARSRHKGRTTWVWEVDITDDEDRLCALVRMTVAVRPLPAEYRGRAGGKWPARGGRGSGS